MKQHILTLALILFSLSAFSQTNPPNPYKIGFGFGYHPKLKDPYIASFKFYTKNNNAWEFIGYNLQNSWKLTTIFNPNLPLNKKGNFRAIAGPGLHIGLWKERYIRNSYTTNPIVGIDAMFGLEYRIPKLPIAFQFHYQPSFDFAGNNDFFLFAPQAGGQIKIVF